MRREDFEHAIRAAGDVLGTDDVVVVGSQAVLGSGADNLPARAWASIEVDLVPYGPDPDGALAERVNGALGEDSRFHQTHGYYADGVSAELIRAPAGWTDRLMPYQSANTNGVTGWCLEPHDICVAKLLAGRDKDIDYVRALVEAGVVDPTVIAERLTRTDSSPQEAAVFLRRLRVMRRPGRRTTYRRVLRRVESWIDGNHPPTGPDTTAPRPRPRSATPTRWAMAARGTRWHQVATVEDGVVVTACGRRLVAAGVRFSATATLPAQACHRCG